VKEHPGLASPAALAGCFFAAVYYEFDVEPEVEQAAMSVFFRLVVYIAYTVPAAVAHTSNMLIRKRPGE